MSTTFAWIDGEDGLVHVATDLSPSIAPWEVDPEEAIWEKVEEFMADSFDPDQWVLNLAEPSDIIGPHFTEYVLVPAIEEAPRG